MDVKRGCSLCPKCGISNGNRARVCKGCNYELRVSESFTAQRKRSRDSTEVPELIHDDVAPQHKRVFSVRLREQGPDYRTMVSENLHSTELKCLGEKCSIAQEWRQRSSAALSGNSTCKHIQSVESDLVSGSNPPTEICLNPEALKELPFPEKTKETLISLHTN